MISFPSYLFGAFVGFVAGFLFHHFSAKVDFVRFDADQWQYIASVQDLLDWLFLDADLEKKIPPSWDPERSGPVLLCRTLSIEYKGQVAELFPTKTIMVRKDGGYKTM